MKTTKERPHKAKIFWQKSERFARAAHANLEAGEYDPAVSNAVNSIINVVDALCVHFAGERSSGENHNDAVGLLDSLKGLDPKTRDALGKRLKTLLSVKSLAQYEGELATKADAREAVQSMDRALAAVAEIAKSKWE